MMNSTLNKTVIYKGKYTGKIIGNHKKDSDIVLVSFPTHPLKKLVIKLSWANVKLLKK